MKKNKTRAHAYTKHALKRIKERSLIQRPHLSDIIDRRLYVKLPDKPGIPKHHILVYSQPDSDWLVVVADSLEGSVLTVLTKHIYESMYGEIPKKDLDKSKEVILRATNSLVTARVFYHYQIETGEYRTKKVYTTRYGRDEVPSDMSPLDIVSVRGIIKAMKSDDVPVESLVCVSVVVDSVCVKFVQVEDMDIDSFK